MTENGHVQRLILEGKEVILVGTAHVSQESVDEVNRIIDEEKPDTVCVELCDSRYQSLMNPDHWKKMDLFKLIKERKGLVLFIQLLLSRFQQKLGMDHGVKPGAEMITAIHKAKETHSELSLIDRDIRTTLLRAWHSCTFWQRMTLLAVFGFASKKELQEISPTDIEQLKSTDMITTLTSIMEKELPVIKRVLIDERDQYMLEKIKKSPGKKIVAVVGAGHVPGMMANKDQSFDTESLTHLKKGYPVGSLIGWFVTLVIIAMLAYHGIYGEPSESLLYWVFVTGISTMISAVVVLAHPLTIISSFFVAPITTLTPLLGAGMVLAALQAILQKPRVGDFENISKDILSLKGWYKNRVTKVLMVLIITSIGAMIGTFIGLGKLLTMFGVNP